MLYEDNRRRHKVMLIVIVFLGWHSVALSADSPKTGRSEESEQAVIYTLNAIRASREALHSGLFHAVEKKTWTVSGDTIPKTRISQILYAFDDRKMLLRYDYNPSGGKVTGASQYISTPDGNTLFRNGGAVFLLAKDQEPDVSLYSPYDIHSVGLIEPLGYEMKIQSSLNDWLKTFSDADERQFSRNGDYVAVTAVSYRDLKNGDRQLLKRKLIVNESKDYAPVRLEMSHTSSKDMDKWSTPDVVETSWTQMNGVWVPLVMRAEEHITGQESRIELTFTWKSVNEEVPAEYFNYESFGLKDDTLVVDKRLDSGTPVIVKRIGEPSPKEVMEQLKKEDFSSSTVLDLSLVYVQWS